MKLPHLTRYELELMNVIWSKGSATVLEVCESLKRPLAYTTVLTTLGLLHARKKVLKREKRGRRHVYMAAVSREEVMRATIAELGQTLFAAHPIGLMLALLDSGGFSKHDLKALKGAIRDLERRGSAYPISQCQPYGIQRLGDEKCAEGESHAEPRCGSD